MWKFSILGSVFLIASQSTAAPVVTDAPRCSAVSIGGGSVYVGDLDSKKDSRYVVNTDAIRSVDVSPDRTKVVYFGSESDSVIYVTDLSGRLESFGGYGSIVLGRMKDRYRLVAASWASNTVLRLEYHIGKDSSAFKFLRIPESSGGGRLTQIGVVGEGADCALSSTSSQVACIDAGGRVAVDGSSAVVGELDELAGTLVVEANVPLGTSLSIPGYPNITVDAVSIEASKGVLRIHGQNNFQPEVWLASRDYLPVPIENGDELDVSPVFNDNANVMSISVRLRRDSDDYGTAIAWAPDGGTIFSMRMGALRIVIPAGNKGWKFVRAIKLPQDVLARHFRFLSDDTMYFSGASNSWILSKEGNVIRTLKSGKSAQEDIGIIEAGRLRSFVGWSCTADAN